MVGSFHPAVQIPAVWKTRNAAFEKKKIMARLQLRFAGGQLSREKIRLFRVPALTGAAGQKKLCQSN